MRTTLTIDDDVMVRLRDEARRLRVPVSGVVNMTLRRALSGTRVAKKVAPLKTYASKLRKGVKPDSFNQLVDALEDGAISTKLACG
ncbi:MAG: hypothetical protein Q8S33_13355 [Myxococcales bacterium]|nr:hypothetical protein [Myxococcales bacterium]